jgi:hypothetical protein
MKLTIFFLVLLFSFSACTDFQHVHYRKLKKVPAKGFVAPYVTKEREVVAGEKDVLTADSAKVISPEKRDSINDQPVTTLKDNRGYYQKQIRKLLPHKRTFGRKPVQFKKPVFHKKGDGSVFLIFVFLFLGVLLMSFGGAMFVTGFYQLNIWLILLGAVVFLLGLLPFLGLLSFMFGGKSKHPPAYYEEKR